MIQYDKQIAKLEEELGRNVEPNYYISRDEPEVNSDPYAIQRKNPDPYATTWTEEERVHKQLYDLQIMRDTLLDDNGGQVTDDIKQQLDDYDAQIAQTEKYLEEIPPVWYVDKKTGEHVVLGKGYYLPLIEKAYVQYKESIGHDIDPYSNLLSVLAGEGLKPGDNLLVEYAKTFVGELPYKWGGESLAEGVDCSEFVHCIYDAFGIKVEGFTGAIASDAENGNCEVVIKGPCMSTNGEDATNYDGEYKEEAKDDIRAFCDTLETGDLILFHFSDRNDWAYGDVTHVVMYAGDGMIVEEYSSGHKAYYRPIEELIFNDEDSSDIEYWRTRLPVYAVRYLTEEQRDMFTVK